MQPRVTNKLFPKFFFKVYAFYNITFILFCFLQKLIESVAIKYRIIMKKKIENNL